MAPPTVRVIPEEEIDQPHHDNEFSKVVSFLRIKQASRPTKETPAEFQLSEKWVSQNTNNFFLASEPSVAHGESMVC